ncbi:MAG: SDR family NAD(P)-dependent oxidoreductase [Desulfosporosinus sp.]
MLFKRVAMITGSGGGIGEGVAKKLSELGGNVVIKDVDQVKVDRVVQVKVDRVVQGINDNGREAMDIIADITKLDEVENMFKAIISWFGKIDILVDNAIQLPKGELLV